MTFMSACPIHITFFPDAWILRKIFVNLSDLSLYFFNPFALLTDISISDVTPSTMMVSNLSSSAIKSITSQMLLNVVRSVLVSISTNGILV